MTYEENGGDAAEFDMGIDPDDFTWLPGVDYVAGWQSAQPAAEALRAALVGVGLDRCQFTVTAGTRADGRGVVRLKGTPYGARRLVQLLEQLASGGGLDGA